MKQKVWMIIHRKNTKRTKKRGFNHEKHEIHEIYFRRFPTFVYFVFFVVSSSNPHIELLNLEPLNKGGDADVLNAHSQSTC